MKLLGLVLLALPLFGQASQDHNVNSWFMYFGDHPIAKSRWGAHLEGQWRRSDVVNTWQQLLLRPAVNYQLNSALLLTGGYGFIQSYPYGDFPASGVSREHRFFEQLVASHTLGKVGVSNRFRLEQRNIGSATSSDYRYENRMRHMIRAAVPLNIGDRKNSVIFYNEIMFNFGRNVERNVFDQNRAYVAFARELGHQTRLEAGYLEQTVQRRGGAVFEFNHTLQFAIYSRLPFFGD